MSTISLKPMNEALSILPRIGAQDTPPKTSGQKPRDTGSTLALDTSIDSKKAVEKLVEELLNKFVDHLLENAAQYSSGHTSQEALNFVLDKATNENGKEILQRKFTQENDGKITPNKEFISKLDQILEKRMHEEQSKTGIFSPVFHNIGTKAYAKSQDRETYWLTHLPDHMDYT